MGEDTLFRCTFQLLRSLLVRGAGHFFRSLPTNLALCIMTCLSIAWLVWQFVIPPEWIDAIGANLTATALIVFYGLAGVLWGIQRSLDKAASATIQTLETASPVLFDSVLDGILMRTSLPNAEIPLSELQTRWDEATDSLAGASPNGGRGSIVGSLAKMLSKRLLRRRTAIITETLDEFAERGETRITLASAKESLRDHLVQTLVELSRGQARTARWVTALVLSALLVLPVAVCWTYRLFS
jgi:hypothetical protein